ncbi:MAG: hypothetical protein V3W17_01255, partial [Desulfobacteria bacterium]
IGRVESIRHIIDTPFSPCGRTRAYSNARRTCYDEPEQRVERTGKTVVVGGRHAIQAQDSHRR